MKMRIVILTLVLLSWGLGSMGLGSGNATSPSSPQTPLSTPTFTWLDITLDPHGQSLAAYQVEITVDPNRVKLVGVEGGEPKAFKEAPYYDPAALGHSRIIVAALSTSESLPTGRTRVARLHVQSEGEIGEIKTTLMAASNPKLSAINVDVSCQQGTRKGIQP